MPDVRGVLPLLSNKEQVKAMLRVLAVEAEDRCRERRLGRRRFSRRCWIRFPSPKTFFRDKNGTEAGRGRVGGAAVAASAVVFTCLEPGLHSVHLFVFSFRHFDTSQCRKVNTTRKCSEVLPGNCETF